MAKGFVKVLLFGAAAGAVWYFLQNSLNPQTEESDEDFDDFSDDDFFEEDEEPARKYVTLDTAALKEKAGDVIDKVAPVFDSASKKVSPLIEKAAPYIEAAKDKVSEILGNDDSYNDDEDIYEEETVNETIQTAQAGESSDAVEDLDAALDSVDETTGEVPAEEEKAAN